MLILLICWLTCTTYIQVTYSLKVDRLTVTALLVQWIMFKNSLQMPFSESHHNAWGMSLFVAIFQKTKMLEILNFRLIVPKNVILITIFFMVFRTWEEFLNTQTRFLNSSNFPLSMLRNDSLNLERILIRVISKKRFLRFNHCDRIVA